MSRLWLFSLCLLFVSTSLAYPNRSAPWPHRSIIYFAPQYDEHVKRFLLESLMNECALKERDIVTLIITKDGQSEPHWVRETFDLNALFHVYQIDANQHTAVLIDKDGREKYRWGKATDWSKLKQVIDNSPIRQRENDDGDDPCSI